MTMKRTIALAALPLLALAACGGGSSESAKTVTQTVTSSSSSTSETPSESSSSADYATPPADAAPTEPTGLSTDLSAEQRDNFMSFRNTMNVVVPKSYGLSDTELLGVAAYACSQLQTGQPESLVIMAIPGLIQRTAPGQPTWDQEDARQAVAKSEAVYCTDQLAS